LTGKWRKYYDFCKRKKMEFEEPAMTTEEEAAMAQARFENIQKKINQESWDTYSEQLLREWKHKADGWRWLHERNARLWRAKTTYFTLFLIIFNAITSIINFVGAAQDDYDTRIAMFYTAGCLAICASGVATFQGYLGCEKRSLKHWMKSVQFGAFSRGISATLTMIPSERLHARVRIELALQRLGNLLMDSPPINAKTITSYRKYHTLSKSDPNIISNDLSIKIRPPDKKVK
jgi:hypothetical protein